MQKVVIKYIDSSIPEEHYQAIGIVDPNDVNNRFHCGNMLGLTVRSERFLNVVYINLDQVRKIEVYKEN